jgi:hypothetical protein
MLERFGKSIEGVVPFKKDFFESNDKHLQRVLEVALEYSRQPLRQNCKNCGSKFTGINRFKKHGVSYAFCADCGHCCGDWEETPEFLRYLYSDDQGERYAKGYSADDAKAYWARVKAIYQPKISFLTEVLQANNVDALRLKCIDIGAGSGYLIGALRDAGYREPQGYDVSLSQATMADTILGGKPIICHAVDEEVMILGTAQADLVTMIGFIEHAASPLNILDTVVRNLNIKYLFMTFPLFSPTVFFENAFMSVFPRHLGGAHTHLYTANSMDWLERRFGLKPLGKWWFGTDILDLYRSIAVSLPSNSASELNEKLSDTFYPHIDQLQLTLDTARKCSSVHVVYAVERKGHH